MAGKGKHKEREMRETMTAEREAQAGIGGVEALPQGGAAQRVIAAPLDRLLKEGRITSREWQAGDTFREDAYVADVDPGATGIDWRTASPAGFGSRVPSMFSSQHIANARMRHRRVKDAFPERGLVWSTLYLGLIREHSLEDLGKLFGEGNPRDARHAGASGFRMACAALADHYGL